MPEHILRAQAQLLHEQFDDHDTDDFMRRLAARIARETAHANHPTADDHTAPAAPPAPPPPDQGTPPPPKTAWPLSLRKLRRRPAVVTVTDQSSQVAVLRRIQHLCDAVLRSEDIGTLKDFADDYDQAGARTFACLLYLTNRRESALYWWRFAAGAGDPLAAHLLAAHHAAVGCETDARLWRAFARMLGFTKHHLPQPLGKQADIAEHVARTVPGNSQQRQFMESDHLARELIHH
ncbi:hypothetical protein [Streptomyces albipurpureus]|uniref:Uncharacterized protein n=1 Tax=Streptomyces albipurpureus TaxID=2897419 RepID=A0ABT0UZM1_9ACTN|nr:hypothetical protein [Streptomyces sp. CWNU-1]MCM2393914.1 hypothetical protein [Streptomyces sp. CWNU-1]